VRRNELITTVFKTKTFKKLWKSPFFSLVKTILDTYLLKSGTEARYLQELLGRSNNSSKATEIYTNMNWQLERICSENYYLRQLRKRFFTIKT
jgi:hypothetical protein